MNYNEMNRDELEVELKKLLAMHDRAMEAQHEIEKILVDISHLREAGMITKEIEGIEIKALRDRRKLKDITHLFNDVDRGTTLKENTLAVLNIINKQKTTVAEKKYTFRSDKIKDLLKLEYITL